MTDERDDEMLGRALSRAIETQDVSETAFERSRVAMPKPNVGLFIFQRVGGAAAVLVFGALLASWIMSRPALQPVAASETPAASAIAAGATATPVATTTPQPVAIDHDVIYVARIGLPPVSFRAPLASNFGREQRIAAHITALRALRPDSWPPDTRNFLWGNTFQGGVSVTISGELATVDLLLEDKPWSVGETGAATGILQQLVYTATEEPGIRAVLFTHDRGQQMRIGDVAITQPLTRENVFGYKPVDPRLIGEEFPLACTAAPCPTGATKLTASQSVDVVGRGVTRFTIQIDGALPPSFGISPLKADTPSTAWAGKYVLRIDVAGTEVKPGLELVERTPLRAIRSSVDGGRTTYELAMDDLRPWRVVTLSNPYRVVIDFGGYVTSVSDSIAVYAPVPGDPPMRQFAVRGLASVFEASVSWRLRDSTQRVVANGVTTASIGTSRQWGTFEFNVAVPSSAAPGDMWLEVYSASPKDGSDLGLVRVQLKVG